MNRIQRAVPLVMVAALAITGCSGQEDKAETTVRVVVHDSFSLPDSLIKKFETETGYKLVTSSAGEAGVVNQLILTKDHPKYDAAYGVDGYSAYDALDEGIFAPLSSDKDSELANTLANDVLEDALVPVDQGDVCVNVDHAWFEAKQMAEPESIADLATKEYAPLLVTENPATSATGLAFFVATTAQDGGFEEYWKSMLENGTKVAAGWSDAYYSDFSGADGKGDYPLVVSYSSSPAETGGKTGSIDGTCTRQVEYAGVIEGAKNSAGGQAFVDFMLSDSVQEALPESMYMYPINPDIALPENWATYAQLSEQPIAVDLKEVSLNRTAWIKKWTEIYERQGN